MKIRTAPQPPRPLSPGGRAALYGALTALALVAGYLEMLLPLPVGVPGVKLGLGNAVVLVALDRLGWKPAGALMLFKVIASTILFANPQTFLFSLAGGALSWLVMAAAARSKAFSVVAISVLGGIAHNIGQLLTVAVLLSPTVAWANALFLLVAGVLCGAAVGVLVRAVLAALPRGGLHGL